jgi:hypothetical protein
MRSRRRDDHDEGTIMKIWVGAAMLAATVSLSGAFASAPAMAAADTSQKAVPQGSAKATDLSAQRRYHHAHHRHHHFGHRHVGYRHGFYPRVYGPRYGYGYGYRPHYRSYDGPAYYGRPYAYRPAYYGGGYGRPYGYGGYGYRPYGAYGYGGPGFGFGGGPLSVGLSFGRW